MVTGGVHAAGRDLRDLMRFCHGSHRKMPGNRDESGGQTESFPAGIANGLLEKLDRAVDAQMLEGRGGPGLFGHQGGQNCDPDEILPPLPQNGVQKLRQVEAIFLRNYGCFQGHLDDPS